MNADELRAMFRKVELERREQRRKILLNTFALDQEPLNEDDLKADQTAKLQLIKQQLHYERETSPGYWTRLWAALWGR